MTISVEDRIAHLNIIYEDVPFIVTYKDPSLSMLYCNKLMREYVGVKQQDQIVGKSDYDFRWADFADLYTRHESDALHNKIYMAMFPVCDFEGNHALVSCHRTPIFDKDDQPNGVLSHTYFLYNKESLELTNLLSKNEPENKFKTYTVGAAKFSEIKLSEKEHECLFYLIRGKSCKKIGKILGLSFRTIEDYLVNLKIKFNCNSKGELIESAIQKGYLYDLPISLMTKNFNRSLD